MAGKGVVPGVKFGLALEQGHLLSKWYGKSDALGLSLYP